MSGNSSLIKFEGLQSLIDAGLLEVASIRVALASDLPGVACSVLSDITTIEWNSDGLAFSLQPADPGYVRCMIDDLDILADGAELGPFQYVVFYDDASLNKNLLFYYDHGSALTLADGECLRVEFDRRNGAFAFRNNSNKLAA